MISFYGCHAIFVKTHQSFGNVIDHGTWIVGVMLIVLEEGTEFFKFITGTQPWVDHIVVRWIKLWNDVDDIIETEHAHIVVHGESILNDLDLNLKQRQRVVSNQLDVFSNKKYDIRQVRIRLAALDLLIIRINLVPFIRVKSCSLQLLVVLNNTPWNWSRYFLWLLNVLPVDLWRLIIVRICFELLLLMAIVGIGRSLVYVLRG